MDGNWTRTRLLSQKSLILLHYPACVKTLLRPYPEKAVAFWAVDRRVGNVRNDSPDLFAPLNGAQK